MQPHTHAFQVFIKRKTNCACIHADKEIRPLLGGKSWFKIRIVIIIRGQEDYNFMEVQRMAIKLHKNKFIQYLK